MDSLWSFNFVLFLQWSGLCISYGIPFSVRVCALLNSESSWSLIFIKAEALCICSFPTCSVVRLVSMMAHLMSCSWGKSLLVLDWHLLLVQHSGRAAILSWGLRCGISCGYINKMMCRDEATLVSWPILNHLIDIDQSFHNWFMRACCHTYTKCLVVCKALWDVSKMKGGM